MTTRTVEQKIALTPEQLQLLQETERDTQVAIQRTNLVVATILAGEGIRGATLKGLEPGNPAQLVVTVPVMNLMEVNGEQPVPEASAG